MKTKIYHSVNASLYFWSGKTGLLIDGIFEENYAGMSLMTPAMRREIREQTGIFSHLDGMLFTHLHEDHFSPETFAGILKARPDLAVYGIGLKESNVPVAAPQERVRQFAVGDFVVRAVRTVHDGEVFRNFPHESFLLQAQGENIYVAGDAEIHAEDAPLFSGCAPGGIDAAFVNVYQLGSASGQEFLRQINPARIYLYHLPFPKDDQMNYYSMVKYVLKKLPKSGLRAEILPQGAWLDGEGEFS